MPKPTAAEQALARWLLAAQAGDAAPGATAIRRVWEKLGPSLSISLAEAGVEALARRAVYLARESFPSLRQGAGNGFGDLRFGVDGEDSELAAEAAEAVLAHFVHLLTTFIGEALAMRVIRREWPDATLQDNDSPAEEAPR